MSSKAQERLVELEKSSAPFEDQLDAAATYIKWNWETTVQQPTVRVPVGSEDWLLKWLMRRLQEPKNSESRSTTRSWDLFLRLIRTVPLEKAYVVLEFRKFMQILKCTLEEAQQAFKWTEGGAVPETASYSSLSGLLFAISAAVQHMVETSTSRAVARTGLSIAPRMQKLLEVTGEDAAKLLGLWLSLARNALSSGFDFIAADLGAWLSSFIVIWKLRSGARDIAETNDAMHFSIHCTEQLLSLVRDMKQSLSKVVVPELDELAAKNIILSAEDVQRKNPESDLLGLLTRLSVLQDSSNAHLLFDVAIRLNLPREPERRKAWHQSVFNTLRKAMPDHNPDNNLRALQSMLISALQHGVVFELPLLRTITAGHALRDDSTKWKLLSTIARLNSEVFLLANDERDLLKETLSRITTASPEECDEATDVATTLMEEFAKARDLFGFIRYWYAQLVELERVLTHAASTTVVSAWEGETLREKLIRLLESSLTISQISQLLEWLAEEVNVNPGAVSVILDGICWSINYWEVVNAVGTTPFHIMFDNGAFGNLQDRYKWRFWSILSRIISWEMPEHHDEISGCWGSRNKPFNYLFESLDESATDLEAVECLRFGCTAWKYARMDSDLHNLAKDFKKYDLDLLGSNLNSLQQSETNDSTFPIPFTAPDNIDLDEESVNTIRGRRSINKQILGHTEGMDDDQKLQLLEKLCGSSSSISLTPVELFKVYHVVQSFKKLPPREFDKEEGNKFDLSSTHAALCSRLYRADGILQFSLIAETLENMLRTKPRAISARNIDSTFGSITIMCSQKGPPINPSQAGNIYLHLCRLFQAILLSHRLSLDNHFHLIVQTMQSLQRCLFIPSHLTTSRTRKTFPPPPWLTDSKHSRLTEIHAAAYTRLVTTICNPSISAITRKQDNNLTSKTEKAKRMAGQHMKYVLTSYIQLQLDMKMLPEVRDKMVPGIRAIFDTTKEDSRKGIYNEVDRDGRTLFEELYKDWDRFGRWKGV